MRSKLPVLFPILLIACSEPRTASSAAAAKPAAPGAALAAARPAPAGSGWDLPDFDDAKQFLSLDSLRWAEVESRVPGDRLARLQALGITLVRSDSTGAREPVDTTEGDDYDVYGENARHFHFVDFSGDGVDDVVYDGPWFERGENGFSAGEGTRFKLYQVIGGRAVQVLSYFGGVQRIFRGERGHPVSLRAFVPGCCADPQWSIDYLAPERAGDTVKYQPYLRVSGREGIVMPARFMERPRTFTVSNDRYLLRESPAIDPPAPNGEDWYRWEGHGNALAEYASGARGIALAEQTDATGRVWWFVRMDGRTGPRDAQFAPLQDDPVRMDRVGWMSSRFLTPDP
ncbi:MAG TPA: hypothetical protein VK358_10220 [Longimicrobium sp.]|nr:hypothetical protein [Longimicrobium sp.]